ncbi:MAG: redoxin domain-containing protein [Planctomycetaceae bacterium]|nr:redoxin domain-containing protein [Planctomycetaceae bacterium]
MNPILRIIVLFVVCHAGTGCKRANPPGNESDSRPAGIMMSVGTEHAAEEPGTQASSESVAGETIDRGIAVRQTAASDMAAVDDKPNSADSAQSATQSADTVPALLKRLRELRTEHSVDDPSLTQQRQRECSQEIVRLSAQVLRRTVDVPELREQFLEGVEQLLEARLKLAVSGTREDMDLLYADVEALNARTPGSAEAAEGQYYLARFAHLKARREPEKPRWFEDFARRARQFADQFPQQEDRCVALLFGAGRSCELHSLASDSDPDAARLMTEAKLCYAALSEDFSATPEGAEAAAVLRRLDLPGKRLTQFAGPTLDGGYVSTEELQNKVTVIYFWESKNQEFRNGLLPLLKQAEEVSANRVRYIGVCLDAEESVVSDFVRQQSPPGSQIYFTDSGQRGWNNPVVRFWGVSRVPLVWLVRTDGVVHAVDVRYDHLVRRMREMFVSAE